MYNDSRASPILCV